MKVMVLVKATRTSEAGVMPSTQLLSEMGKFNEELVKAGVLLVAEGLHPSSRGARVRFSGEQRSVVDGPFAETNELVAGFWLWQVKSMEEAIAWVKRCPNPMPEESEIEIRRIFEAADFGAAVTPDIQDREERLRAEVERYNLDPPRYENGRDLRIAGLNATYTFETRVEIPSQWRRFAPHIGKIPGQVGNVTYGVCWNFKSDRGFDYLTGVEIGGGANVPHEFSEIRLPAARYAVFSHRKHVSTIPQSIDAIWKKWLPNSGYQAAETPAFERYDEDFDPRTGMGGIEIWLPIKG
jgi:AraC family transcriptional regulator